MRRTVATILAPLLLTFGCSAGDAERPASTGTPDGDQGASEQSRESLAPLEAIASDADAANEAAQSNRGLSVKNRSGVRVTLVFANRSTAQIRAGKNVTLLMPCNERFPVRARDDAGRILATLEGPCDRSTWVIRSQNRSQRVEARQCGQKATRFVTQRTPKPRDKRLIDALISFAENPDRDRLAALPLAQEVALLIGCTQESTLSRNQAQKLTRWDTFINDYGLTAGPYNALRYIRQHAKRSATGASAFDVRLGARQRCAGPAVTAPAEYRSFRRVSVQPSLSAGESCLAWFSVDLYLGSTGQIEAVAVEQWEY